MEEIHRLLSVSKDPHCNPDLQLCQGLFDPDHVDDAISLLELVQAVGNIPRWVKSCLIRTCKSERSYLERLGESKLFPKRMIIHRLACIEDPCPSLVVGQARLFEPVEDF